MNARQDRALMVLHKRASAMSKNAGAVSDFFNNPDNQRLLATYALPTLVGGGIGALANKRNRLLGALIGGAGGAAVGGGLHALQHYNVGGLGDWAKGLFAPKTPFDPVTGQPYDVPDQMASSDKYQKEKPQQVTNVSPDDPNNPIKSKSVQDSIKAQRAQDAAKAKANAKRDAAVEQRETQNLNNSVIAEQDAIAGDARLKAEQAAAKARADQAQRERTAAEDSTAFSKEPNAAGYYDAEDAERTLLGANARDMERDEAAAKALADQNKPYSIDLTGGAVPSMTAKVPNPKRQARLAAQEDRQNREVMEARMNQAAEATSREGFDEAGDVPFGAFNEPTAGAVSAPAQEAREILRRLKPGDPNYANEMNRVNQLNAQSRAARGEASPAQVLSALTTEQANNAAMDRAMADAANSADRAEYDARVGEEAIRDPYTVRMNALRMRANKLAQAQMEARAKAPSFLWALRDPGVKNYDQEMAAINREMAQLRALRDGKRPSPAQALSNRIIARENRRKKQYEDLVNGYRGGSFEDTFGH